MKRKGSNFEYEEERGRDLMRVYRAEIAKHRFISLPEVMVRVVNSPAQRFWVSEARATRVIRQMMQGRAVCVSGEMKREMYEEILCRVQRVLAEHPEVPLHRAVAQVVRQPAPKFFLTAGSAAVILFNIRRRMRGKKEYRLRS